MLVVLIKAPFICTLLIIHGPVIDLVQVEVIHDIDLVQVEVIHDGGVQRGTDIAKALALGADGVNNIHSIRF